MDKSKCSGCRDDFYNGQGADECWSLKTAKIVTRYRIGTWTQPTERFAFSKVKVPSCYRQQGQHFTDALPDFVKVKDVRK